MTDDTAAAGRHRLQLIQLNNFDMFGCLLSSPGKNTRNLQNHRVRYGAHWALQVDTGGGGVRQVSQVESNVCPSNIASKDFEDFFRSRY